jgi:hypothetical protein
MIVIIRPAAANNNPSKMGVEGKKRRQKARRTTANHTEEDS